MRMPKNPPKTGESERAVIYARYSSHNQSEQSIEGQLRDNYEWANRNNVTVIGEYIDRALSGTVDSRPDFQRMIEDAAKRQFTMIIVWKLDRFARNRFDSATYKAKLKKFGVRVVSVKETITDGPEGIIMEGLLESMAEYYSANLSQNVKRGLRESAEKGQFCGGIIPYGYKVQDKHLVPDEKTAPNIIYVFEQYAQGVSKKDIIDELNRRGVRNRNGNPLCYTSFQHAMRMTSYVGEHVYKGQVIPGCAVPLISREVFDKVQQRLDAAVHTNSAQKAFVPYLLQGKAFCGICGAPMFGESGKSHTGKIHSYYSCYNRKRTHTCQKKNEKREALESYIVERTLSYILTPARVKDISRAVVKEYEKEFSGSRVLDYEKALAQIDRELEKLIDAIVDAPKVAHKKIYARMEALEAQKTEFETEAAKLRVAMNLCPTQQEVAAWIKTFRDGNPEDSDFRLRLVETFINSVYVWENRIIIFYNIRAAAPVAHSALSETLQNESYPNPSKGSDTKLPGGAYHSVSEPCFVFVHGVFGCVFPREK